MYCYLKCIVCDKLLKPRQTIILNNPVHVTECTEQVIEVRHFYSSIF
jgi:hypothetical protein